MKRQEYEMTEEDLVTLKEACKPVAYMVVGGVEPRSPAENAMAVWRELGKRMGFDPVSVLDVVGKGDCFFSAIPLFNALPTLPRVEPTGKDAPLKVSVEGEELVIRMGIDRLDGHDAHPSLPALKFADREQWVKDVILELTSEDEVGGTPLIYLLESCMDSALNNGSIGIAEDSPTHVGFCHMCSEHCKPLMHTNYGQICPSCKKAREARDRLECLRLGLNSEHISLGELAELHDLVEYIEPGDLQLLEAAGVPEDVGTRWGEEGVIEQYLSQWEPKEGDV